MPCQQQQQSQLLLLVPVELLLLLLLLLGHICVVRMIQLLLLLVCMRQLQVVRAACRAGWHSLLLTVFLVFVISNAVVDVTRELQAISSESAGLARCYAITGVLLLLVLCRC